jgi:hypothetical protein
METEDISYVIRCIGAIAGLLGLAGAVFTYCILLELPIFTNLLIRFGLY